MKLDSGKTPFNQAGELIFSILAAVLFLSGCAQFGGFSGITRKETTKDEVMAMLGEPEQYLYVENQEVWKYRMVKTEKLKRGAYLTVAEIALYFSGDVVLDYKLRIAREQQGMSMGDTIESAGPSAQPAAKAKPFIVEFDGNGDGKVSKKEFRGPSDVFERFDRNRDGQIDAAEAPSSPPPTGR